MGAMLVRHEPTSVAVVRREIATDLASNGVDQDCVDDVTLVVSELVGNAVRHTELSSDGLSSDGDLNVSWTISARNVVVSVADPSDEQPLLRVAAPNEPAGRGLALVDMLSSAWGVEALARGKRVWARVPTE